MRSPTGSVDHFVLTLWTADPLQARLADAAGIDRIGVDLERLGKLERQRGLGTWLSSHVEADLDDLGRALTHAQLFARVNPLNPDSRREVESVLARGAKVVMLPMVKEAEEVARFAGLIGGRATLVLLIEHFDALERLAEMIQVDGVDEVHIGLNDMALSLGLPNRWLVLAGEMAAEAGAIVRAAGLRFGLGGIGRAGDADLPVPADLVYAEYARTGARAALVSRSFFRADGLDMKTEVRRARRALANWCRRPASELAAAHAELGRRAAQARCW
jgi:2-keto-3-deoxy-L-rhamnonate aldolase RhmA